MVLTEPLFPHNHQIASAFVGFLVDNVTAVGKHAAEENEAIALDFGPHDAAEMAEDGGGSHILPFMRVLCGIEVLVEILLYRQGDAELHVVLHDETGLPLVKVSKVVYIYWFHCECG